MKSFAAFFQTALPFDAVGKPCPVYLPYGKRGCLSMQAVRKAVLSALPACDRMVEELMTRTRDVNQEVTAAHCHSPAPPPPTPRAHPRSPALSFPHLANPPPCMPLLLLVTCATTLGRVSCILKCAVIQFWLACLSARYDTFTISDVMSIYLWKNGHLPLFTGE